MPQKSAKIDDVKSPDKVTPAASSRPIIVTNRPVLANDPMVVPDDAKTEETEPGEDTVTRTAKTIKPLSGDMQPADETTAEDEKSDDGPASDELPAKTTETEADKPQSEARAEDEPVQETDEENDGKRDAGAAANADATAVDAAKAAREEELESIIASGKYAVPINAVQRRQTKIMLTTLCIVVLLAAAGVAAYFLVPSFKHEISHQWHMYF